MTNSYTKIVLLAVAVLALVFTSCKKDDEEYPSFTLDTSSMDFEWGQTKDLGFSHRMIRKYNAPTVPTGWTCTRDGDRFIITAPAEGGSAASTGTIEFTADTDNNSTITRKLTVAIKIAEEIPRMANSIIITEPGKRYKFNALRRGNETAETITGATSATRLWTTSTKSVINVSLEGKHIYFATGEGDAITDGNTVIAVRDKDNNILWSWHIWTTDFDPAANPDVVGGLRVMNRNLGATTNSGATGEEAVRSYGLYYQWGRKDPFIGPVAWDSTTPRSLYNASGYSHTHSFIVSSDKGDDDKDGDDKFAIGSVEWATANPNTFIAGYQANGFDWLSNGHNTGLWSSTAKTVYDPCPVGWRVAPPSIWANFTTTGTAVTDPAQFNTEGEYKYGWTFAVLQPSPADESMPADVRRVFYPAAGRRSFSPTLASTADNYTNIINYAHGEAGLPVGFYWSGEHPIPATAGSGEAGVLVFRNDYINPAAIPGDKTEQQAPASGFPLRCVAE